LNTNEEGNEPAECKHEEPHHLSHNIFAVTFSVTFFPLNISCERVWLEFRGTDTE
jgi:hypothetical protein